MCMSGKTSIFKCSICDKTSPCILIYYDTESNVPNTCTYGDKFDKAKWKRIR
jgi:hypothetical protein